MTHATNKGGTMFKSMFELRIILQGIVLLLFGAPLDARIPNDPQSHYLGEKVFNEKGCSSCHSVNGNGGKGGPDLGHDKYYGTHLELASTMWNHFPRMEKKMMEENREFLEITEDEMTSLIDFLLFMRYRGEKGSVFRGRKLLESMECVTCHRFGGQGGDIGPDISAKEEYLSPLILAEAMWNHGPEMRPLFEEHGIRHRDFIKNDFVDLSAAIKSYITPTSVPANAYLLGDPDRGRILITEKGCVKCHDLKGSSSIGPSFENMEFEYTVLEFSGHLWNHGPRMWDAMKEHNITVPQFQGGELSDIVTFVYKSKLNDRPGDPDIGYNLLFEKKCLDCHTIKGIGNNTAKKDFAEIRGLNSPIALISKMWSHAPAIHQKMEEKKIRWPRLNSREMADIYAYFLTINQ